jgi:hypothetical protein
MSETSTGQVVADQLEPVTKADPVAQPVVTGQYLYTEFIETDEVSKTRMNIVRSLVEIADPMQIKGACDAMVKLAKAKDMLNGFDEKTRGPKQATAMNTRTVFQQVYGALKFAPDEMMDQGYTLVTGWNEARVMAKAALTASRKVWTGHDVPTDVEKQVAALKREQKEESTIIADGFKDNPRLPGESREDWQTRVMALNAAKVESIREKKEQEIADDVALKLFEKHGKGRSYRIAVALLLLEGVEIGTEPKEVIEVSSNEVEELNA